MFVIVQCLRYQKNQQINSSVEEALGSALKHTGVSITVTSVTDILAFGVGAVTVCFIPKLLSMQFLFLEHARSSVFLCCNIL